MPDASDKTAKTTKTTAAKKTIRSVARKAVQGDIAPTTKARALGKFIASEAVDAAQGKAIAAALNLARPGATGTAQERAKGLRAMLEGASPDDARVLREALMGRIKGESGKKGLNPDDLLADDWRDGGYPYRHLMRRSTYEETKFHLQVELLKLQAWVKETGQRVVILFEGRDAAGKGGAIKRFMEHLNPRGARVVALEKPSEMERGQWYFQRYVQHLPTRGEIVLLDRSWYNRAGVEKVMGFCSDEDYEEFFRTVPEFEKMLIRSGIILIKYWFSITDDEQNLRFMMRIHDPLKQWKLSPMDMESRRRWEQYTKAKETMLERTHIPEAPWRIIEAVDKKKARLNCIHHLLSQVPYQEIEREAVTLPARVHNPDYLRNPVPEDMLVPQVY